MSAYCLCALWATMVVDRTGSPRYQPTPHGYCGPAARDDGALR
ncbi:MAG: hypothetical protein WCJ17_02400 [bacterium]